DATAELRFYHLPAPLLAGLATADGEEISESTELKPGVPYRFVLDAGKLGGGDVALLVEADALPKGTLSQLTLYPHTAGLTVVTAPYFPSLDMPDETRKPVLSQTVDAPDQIARPTWANSVRFEGYLEAPTGGAYRLFAQFGKKDARAKLRFYHLPNPLIDDQ